MRYRNFTLKKSLGTAALAGLLVLCLLLLAACEDSAANEERDYTADEFETTCITFTYGPSPDPFNNRQRVIELYPDGTARLTDTAVVDEANGSKPYGPGEAPVLKQHSFFIQQWTYAALEKELFKSKFFAMDEDLGVNATDLGYDSIAAQYNGGWHSVGASGWPQDMREILNAYRQVLNNAYLEEEDPGEEENNFPYADVSVTRTAMYREYGILHIYQTVLRGDGTRTYTFIDSKTLTPEDDPLTLLPSLEGTTSYASYIDLDAFAGLVEYIEEIDFFGQPEKMTYGRQVELDEEDALYTQRYTVTVGEQSHTVEFPPEYYFFNLDWYGELYTRFGEVSETSGTRGLTMAEVLRWD